MFKNVQKQKNKKFEIQKLVVQIIITVKLNSNIFLIDY